MLNISIPVRENDYLLFLHSDTEKVHAIKKAFEETRQKCQGFPKIYDKPTVIKAEFNKETKLLKLYLQYSNLDIMLKCFLNLSEYITFNDWPSVTSYDWVVYLDNVQQVAEILKSVPW
jgi:hypothetical protein